MVDLPPTPPKIEIPVSPRVSEFSEETSLQLLQLTIAQPDETDTDARDAQETTNPNELSTPRIQAIQELITDEFTEEIEAIQEAITAEYIDTDLLKEKLKILTKALAGGRGRQGITLVKKGGNDITVKPYEITKKNFKKPTFEKEDEKEVDLEKDVTAKEVEQALRELPSMQEKIATLLSQHIEETKVLVINTDDSVYKLLENGLGKFVIALRQSGFEPTKAWKRSDVAKVFTDELQDLGTYIKTNRSLKSSYRQFLSAVEETYEKGIIATYLAKPLLSDKVLDKQILIENPKKKVN